MGSLFYFVPHVDGFAGQVESPAERLVRARAELSYAFDEPVEVVGIDCGPDGLPGMALTQGRVTLPAKIEWRRLGESDAALGLRPGGRDDAAESCPAAAVAGCWIGFDPADKPGPADLRRVGGRSADWGTAVLADGGDWRVPIIVPCRELDSRRRCNLERLNIGAAARAIQFDLEKFLVVESVPAAAVIQLAARILGIGYRVSLAELRALKLLPFERARDVVRVALDWNERIAARALLSHPERRVCGDMVRQFASAAGGDHGLAARAIASVAVTAADADSKRRRRRGGLES